MLQINSDGWYGIKEAAKLLVLSPQSVYRLVESNQIKVYRAGGHRRPGKLLFRGEWLLEYIESHTTRPVKVETIS